MDRREDIRIGTADARPIEGGAIDSSFPASKRFAKFVGSPTARRLVVSRVGRVGLAALLIAASLFVVGSSAIRSMSRWLHNRQEYKLAFRDIQLIPDPPKWIRGGRDALLEQIRAGRKHLESFSTLDLDLSALQKEFSLNPWIARVARADNRYPNTIRVMLSYREPVATIAVDKGGRTITLDGDGVVLPNDELDPGHIGRLIPIVAVKNVGELKPGVVWKEKADADPGAFGPQARVVRAAAIARLFREKLQEQPSLSLGLTPRSILADDENVIWVVMADADESLVLWLDKKRVDAVDEPSDAEKFDRLSRAVRQDGSLKARYRDNHFVKFDRDGIHVAEFTPRTKADKP